MSSSEESTETGRRSIILRALLFATIATVIILSSSSTIVNDNEKALILRFGKTVRTITSPGWYFHLPKPLEKTLIVDSRLQHGVIRLSETLTADKRNVILPMYFSWRVNDPLKFLNSVESPEIASGKLDSLITSMRNSVIGRNKFDALVSTGNTSNLSSMESELLALAKPDALEHFGIDLVSVGITEIKLPQGNTESVFRRMRAERKREASTYRAEGKAEADRIITEADTEARLLLADAKRQAEELRGKSEAEAAKIYTDAHGTDVEFYRFLRSLQSLRSVVDKNTTLILDTNSPPFDLLQLKSSEKAPHLKDSTSPPVKDRSAFPAPLTNIIQP